MFENINIKKNTKEQLIVNIKSIFNVWTLSALLCFLPSKISNHQDFAKLDKIKNETENIITPSKKFARDIERQKSWLLSYMKSPKYLERLIKERVRFESIPAKTQEEMSEYFTKYITNESKDTIAILNAFDHWAEYAPEVVKEYDFDSLININNVFPDIDVNNLNDKTKEEAEIMRNIRMKFLEDGNYDVVDSMVDVDGYVVYGLYNCRNGDVSISNNLSENAKETPLHEFTHQSTVGNVSVYETTRVILSRYALTNSEYLKDPTEIMARLNVLRYLLDKNNLYNPLKEDFNEDDYFKMINNKDIKKSFNVKEIINLFNKNELIWLMNNIADATNVNNKPVISPLSHDQSLFT